jgi:hypothetical protein
VQVDPAQAELKQYWNDLEASDQEFLKARCADGMVYQHVVRAFPTSAAGHLNKLQKDLMELEQSHRAEVSRMYEKFEFEKQAWLEEQASVADRTKAEAKQKELEFNSQMNLMLEVQENTQNTLAWTEGQLDNHKQSMQELTTEILSLKTSTSWRMTEPLRALLRKISG